MHAGNAMTCRAAMLIVPEWDSKAKGAAWKA
jgi:hypothetical protein